LVAGLLSYALYYRVPAMLGMTTGYPLYVVGSSTFGTAGGYIMPGLLMGLLQIGWFAVATYFSADYILRGIGMASFELRDYVEAARALGASLRDQRRPLTPEQKRHAEALLARANTFVGRFTVKIKPESASLFVDGRPADVEPDGVVLLAFGRHQLSLRCASCAPAEKDEDVEVSGGEHKTIELALAPAPPPGDLAGGAGAGATGGAVISQPGERDTATVEQSHAHLWLAGGAVVAALGAGGTALWWHDQQHQLDVCRNEATDTHICDNESSINSQRKVAMGLTIGLGAAAVISGAAAALLWPRGDQAPAPAVACVPTNNMVSCSFRF